MNKPFPFSFQVTSHSKMDQEDTTKHIVNENAIDNFEQQPIDSKFVATEDTQDYSIDHMPIRSKRSSLNIEESQILQLEKKQKTSRRENVEVGSIIIQFYKCFDSKEKLKVCIKAKAPLDAYECDVENTQYVSAEHEQKERFKQNVIETVEVYTKILCEKLNDL